MNTTTRFFALVAISSACAQVSGQTTYQDALVIRQFTLAAHEDLQDLVGASFSDALKTKYLTYYKAGKNQPIEDQGTGVEIKDGSVEENNESGKEDKEGAEKANDSNAMLWSAMQPELQWAARFIVNTDTATCNALSRSVPSEFKYLSAINKGMASQAAGVVPTAGLFGGSLMGIGQETIIDGITQFALERAQEELLQAFLREWLDRLQNEPYLQQLFPSTLNMISTSDLVGMMTQGDAWKASFDNDLSTVPERLDTLSVMVLRDILSAQTLDASARLSTARDMDELAAAIGEFSRTCRDLKAKKDWQTVLAVRAYELVSMNSINGPRQPISEEHRYAIVQRALVGSAALVGAVRYKKDGTEEGFVDPMDLLALSKEEFECYWKLICLRYKEHLKVAFDLEDAAVCSLIDQRIGSKAFDAKSHVLKIVENAEALMNLTSTVSESDSRKAIQPEQVDDYVTLVMNLLDEGVSLVKLNETGANSKFITFYDQKARPTVKHVQRIGEGAMTAKYGQVISGSLDLFQFIMDTLRVNVEEPIKPKGTTEKNATIEGTDVLMQAQSDRMERTADAINKYGGFMVDMLTAENSDQVNEALKKVTLGVGSYRIKQTSRWAGMLSLYPGMSLGTESVLRTTDGLNDGSGTKASATVVGVSLPIGISLTYGTGCRAFPAIGLFIQALDLGAPLNYRIGGSDSISVTPAYTFEALLSPGLFAQAHLGRSPITLGLGASVTPRLRTVTTPDLAYQANALRIGGFIGVDVTALRFFASKQKTKGYPKTYRGSGAHGRKADLQKENSALQKRIQVLEQEAKKSPKQ